MMNPTYKDITQNTCCFVIKRGLFHNDQAKRPPANPDTDDTVPLNMLGISEHNICIWKY